MSLFKQGQTADPSIDVGTFLAYLRSDNEEIPTQYGFAIKLKYNVFVPSARGTRVYEQSELAAPQYTTGAKLIRRFAAVNQVDVTEKTDLGTLNEQGWCLVSLGRPRSHYLEITDVVRLPRGYPIPADITDPNNPELPNRQQTVPAVDQVGKDELPGMDNGEPPF